MNTLYLWLPVGGATEPWLGPLLVNGIFSLVIVGLLLRNHSKAILKLGQAYHFTLPLIVVAGATIVASGSRLLSQGITTEPTDLELLIWLVIVVPLVEELLFRGGFGLYFVKKVGAWWGSYWSALLFALCHSNITLSNLFSANFGVPLGPFLLGFLCQFLFTKSGSIWPAIALHISCNLTSFIFRWLDHRWLDWLNWLYL